MSDENAQSVLFADFQHLFRAFPVENSDPHAAGHARRFRRDTHDDDVPAPLHDLLRAALPRCPALELVILERLGDTIHGSEAAARLRDDFTRIRAAIREHHHDG